MSNDYPNPIYAFSCCNSLPLETELNGRVNVPMHFTLIVCVGNGESALLGGWKVGGEVYLGFYFLVPTLWVCFSWLCPLSKGHHSHKEVCLCGPLLPSSGNLFIYFGSWGTSSVTEATAPET